MTIPTDAQIDRIRETVRPTIQEWLTDYGIERDKSHGQLENRMVAAVVAILSEEMTKRNERVDRA